MSKVKKGKDQIRANGLKAAGFLDKVSHVAWDKLKSPRLPKELHRAPSPQNGYKTRDTSNDYNVFEKSLKEAVTRTRIVKERKMNGDAAFWIPALAYRCLQCVQPQIFEPCTLTQTQIPQRLRPTRSWYLSRAWKHRGGG